MNEHQTEKHKNQNNSPRLHLRAIMAWVLENSSRIIRAFQGIFQKGEKLTFYPPGTPGAAGGPCVLLRGMTEFSLPFPV